MFRISLILRNSLTMIELLQHITIDHTKKLHFAKFSLHCVFALVVQIQHLHMTGIALKCEFAWLLLAPIIK